MTISVLILTLTVDSQEEIIERPQPSKISARIESSKEADDDEALPNDIPKGLFFQDWKAIQKTIENSVNPAKLEQMDRMNVFSLKKLSLTMSHQV